MGLLTKIKRYRKSRKEAASEAAAKASKPAKEMSFLDHLEELRWHLVRSLAVIIFFAIFIFIYREWVYDNIYEALLQPDFPLHRIICQLGVRCFEAFPLQEISTGPTDQFFLSLRIAFMGGFIISFPYIIWEFWRFLKPGLYAKERRRFRGSVLVLSFLFFMGVSFAYYVISPFSISFLAWFSLSESIENMWRVNQLVGMVNQIVLAGGLVFEMPVLVYLLSKLGIVTPEGMKKYWRHAVIILLVLSALITPPDVLSQVLIFLPLAGLYRLSIYISAVVNRKRDKEIFGEKKEAEAKKETDKTEATTEAVAENSSKTGDTTEDKPSSENPT